MARRESPANQLAAATAVAAVGLVLIHTIFDRVLPTPATYAMAIHPATVAACTNRITTGTRDAHNSLRVQSGARFKPAASSRTNCLQRSIRPIERIRVG